MTTTMTIHATVSATMPASLYVGDLHPDVTDGQLFDAFSEYKSIASVRICRDSSTGRSLCYGYVNFISSHDAIQAIEAKNNTLLNGKTIRVMWSHRDPDARKSGVANLFVKNMSESINNVELHDLFNKFGKIVSCKVATSEDGKSKGYGFVQFESEHSANAAMQKLNGSTVDGKQIYVGNFIKKSDRVLTSPDAKYTNLYVKNLDLDVSEGLLREKFSKFGKIASLVIARDETGGSRGFGFVNFDNPDDARCALEAMNGVELAGKKVLYVGRAQKKAEREQILRQQFEEKRKELIMKYKGSNVYVKNIDDDVTDEELREHFSQCGTITSAKLMKDDKGLSKGFGFVCFSCPEEANKAVTTFHGRMFHRKPLYVAIAQRKEDRHAQLQLQYAQRIAGLTDPSAAIIPGGYPQYYYAAPPGVASQPRPGMVYQPLGMRPGWGANSFAPPIRASFQAPHLPTQVPGNQRQPRQSRGRANGHMLYQGGARAASNIQQATQSIPKEQSNERAGQVKYVANGRGNESNRGSGVSDVSSQPAGVVSHGSDTLSSLLAAATPKEQKQILGEHLYPLVQKLKPDLVAKITGMLLEMDNSELLLLLESPDSLAAKVEEAVQVLKISKTKVSGQNIMKPNLLSAEVTVN